MSYVLLADAPNYGATSDVTQEMLEQAAVAINSYCGRPFGFLVETNNGEPVCMAYATPSFTYQSSVALNPGQQVPVALPTWMAITLGDVLVIDQGTANAENVAITTINPDGSVLLDNVEFAHSSPLYLAGMVIVEEKKVSAKGRFSLQQTPVVNFVSLCSGTHGIQQPRWADSSRLDLRHLAGDTVKACYLAGYTIAPDAIKSATVLIANQLAEIALQGATYFKSETYAGRSYERFANGGLVDPRIAEYLSPYRSII
jgi:hypothetical protein